METFSELLALCEWNPPLSGGFPSQSPSQRPVTRSFHAFFNLRLNIRLGKLSRRRWFETPSRSLWRHHKEWSNHMHRWISQRNHRGCPIKSNQCENISIFFNLHHIWESYLIFNRRVLTTCIHIYWLPVTERLGPIKWTYRRSIKRHACLTKLMWG